MKETAAALRELVNKLIPHLQEITAEEAALRPQPGKWSAKEILGHLVDSATNNQMKFVRVMEADNQNLPGYDQDNWVALQQYQEYEWIALIEIWALTNRHVAHIIGYSNPALLAHLVWINNTGPFTLEYIMRDYTEHQKHHLRQIFAITDSPLLL